MNHTRRVTVVLFAVLAVGSLSSCGPQRIRTPDASGSDLILLLPDSGGITGGAACLESLRVRQSGRGAGIHSGFRQSAPFSSRGDGRGRCSAALRRRHLEALPPPPEHFTLHFRFESDELTEESRVVLGRILDAIRKRPASEVAVIGHTDTAGTPSGNFELGLKRAQMIYKLLVGEGLATSLIEVTSHGEGDPLVRTADEVLEPRNRRVEISIR